MVTTEQIARHIGVSHQTVSAALTSRWRERRIASATRERVLAAARELGYRPNRLARGLRLRKTNTIGLIIRTLRHPVQSELNERLVQLIEQNGFEALLTVVPDFNDTAEMEELYYSHYPEAIIMGPLYQSLPKAFLNLARRDGYPLVGFEGNPSFPIDQVTHDGWGCYRLGVEHLRSLGHQRIGCTTGQHLAHSEHKFREAAADAFGGYYVYYGTYANGLEFARNLRLGPENPTAYLFEDPTFALGFLRGVAQRGLRVPQDVAFVVLGSCEFASYLPVTFTTTYFDFGEMAQQIFDLALSRLREKWTGQPRCVLLTPRLGIGESSGQPSRTLTEDGESGNSGRI